MEINVWGWLFSETDRLLLKQRCPEVAVFRGCQLDGWYHSTSGGQFMRRRNATITGVLELFRTNAIYQAYDLASGADPPQDHEVDENIPCAILRRRGSNTLRGRGVMDMPQSTVLTLRALTDLLQRALQGAESRDRDVWSVQTIVKPSEDLRVLSLYNCDANGTEKSEIFGRSYTKLYNGDYSSFQLPTEREAGEDGFKPVLAARMAEVEAKTLSVVRFASRFHSLELEGLVLEFIVDSTGHAVLHGCWCCSLFGTEARRKIRSGSVPKLTPSRPVSTQRLFPVPSPSTAGIPTANTVTFLQTSEKVASVPSASVIRPAARASEAVLPKTETEAAPDEQCVLLELWRGNEFVGEAVLPVNSLIASPRAGAGAEKCLRLQAAGAACWPLRPDKRRKDGTGGIGGHVVVTMEWVEGSEGRPALLRVGLLRAERLPLPPPQSQESSAFGMPPAAPRALIWLRRGGSASEFSALFSSREAASAEGNDVAGVAIWDESVDLAVGDLAPNGRTFTVARGAAPGGAGHHAASAKYVQPPMGIQLNVRSATDVVCGAELNTHWGMSEEDGTMRTSVLVQQVSQRLRSERPARSALLPQLSVQLQQFCDLQAAWDDERNAATAAVDSATRQLQDALQEGDRQRQETGKCVSDAEALLAKTCQELYGLVDEHRIQEHTDDVALAQSKMRIEEKRTMVHQLVDRSHALQGTLDRTVQKFDEVSSSYAQVQGDLLRSQALRQKPSHPEMMTHTAHVLELDAEAGQVHAELNGLKDKLSKHQDQLASEKGLAMRMEDFIRRVASAPPARLRMGGGFALDSTAKREAAALLKEMNLATVEQH